MRRIGLFIILQLAIVSAAHAQANTISTYAGGGTNSTTATTAHLPQTYRAVRDTSGNTYISVPSLGTVYKVNGSGTMSIYAGTGVLGFFGDGGPAASAQLDYPLGMALDSAGNLYIADSQNNRIRKVTASSGVITTVAGSGDEYNGAGFFGGYSGDGGSATDALLNGPTDVAVDGSGNFYISDVGNQVVRQVNGGTGTITTYAGTGNAGFSGDGGPATSAKFRQPNGVTLDLSGNLFISDKNNCIVRRVDATTKIITTYAGTPQVCGFSGDSGAATSAELSTPVGVYADAAGFLFIADFGNNRIRKVDNTTAHDISTVAGTGVACTTPTGCGDGGAATSALLNAPKGIFEDASNVLLIADTNDMRVRTVTSGNIANYAGSGNGGNGGPATSGMLSLPYIPNVDGSGNLFILDSFGARIQRVDAVTKNVTTFAGNGVLGVVGATNGDGGQATAASLNYPIAIAFDSTGNIYVADQREFVVRKITLATGVITTIAGNRQQCGSGGSNPNTFPACGDEGAATSASLCIPVGVALDANNNVFISDQCLSRIREVSAGTGVISNYAGDPNNNTGYSGDNGPPTSALMNGPLGIAFSPAGDLYIADTSNNVIREVNTVENIITTYAFNGEPTFGGDGGSASGASMYNPTEIAFDAAGNLFVGGGSDNVVRRIDVNDQTVATVAGNVDNLDGGFFGDGGPSTLALLSNFGLTVDANENLFIADAGNNRIRKVHMVPVASWAPTTLTAFPTLLAGQVSDSQIITFSNTGLNDLTVSVTSISPDFSVSNFCTFEVASPQGSCDLFVSFTPPAGVGAGPVSGSLVLATNDPNNPTVTYPLSGTIASTGFALTVLVVSPAGNVASVSSDPSGISGCGQTGGICTASFASGTVVTLIAGVSSSNPGYAFLGWSGNCTPVVDVPFECTTTVSQVETVTATFGASTLTVSAYGNGSGTITSSPAGINCGATCTFTFPAGTQTVTLTATPNTGSVFVGWEDYYCTSSTGNTCIISLTNYYFSEVAAAVFSVARVPFTKGDVFLGTTGGMIFEYHPSGTLVQVLPPLNSTYFGGFVYGMTFDANGTLYAADPFYDFQNPTAGMETFKFDGTGPTAFGGLSTASAGSVRVDPSGNVFVGLEVNSTTGNLIEFAPGNTTAPSAFYFPAYYQTNGIFAFDIAQDDVTMLYDLGTNSLFSYNIALGLQNPDLTDSLPGTYSGDLRQLPDGTILLADGDRVVRLNSTTGAVIQTYQPAVFSFVLGLTLDGDGVDFWTDDSITGVVYKINIASGAIVTQFNTQLGQSTFGGLVGLGGIAEYGSPASGGEDLSVALAGTGTGSVSSNVAGITCPTACTANYAVGQQVTLTATPAGGSTFAGWSGNCTGTGTCTVTMSAAQAVTATFNTNVTFQFTYIAAGTGTGTVTSSPTGINCTATCTANFASGTVVTLTQTPASGSTFGGWSGACSGTGSCVVTMTSAESVTATFTLSTFPLTVSTAGTGTGTVTSSPSGISCPSTCSANFNSESLVTLTATPVAGSTFAGWSGACNGTGTCPVTMDGAQSVTATFNTTTNVNLTVVLNGTAYGTVTGGAISCSDISGITTGTCTTSVASGTVVTLFEQIGSGSAFGGWSGGGCSGTASSCAVTVTAATTVTATFNNGTGTFLLTVQPSTPSGGQGNGTGTVTSNIGGINCTMANGVVTGGTCTANIASGAIVTLTATPAAGSVFSFWGTDCFGTSTCALTMSAAHTATATFTALNFALTVSELGTGAGTVTSNPTGINCPTTCTANYASGTAVTLTAAAGANSVFAGWSGQGCTGTGVCTVTVNAAETVTATFNPTSVLTVTEVGTGTGTVSSNPAGILCPSTCAASFTTGAQVTLTATPNSGTTFAGWSGAGCSGVGVCTVTMSAAESVTATFNLPTFALTVTDAGTGSGSVTSNPSGITCPSTCSANYNSGTSVTLTAAAGSGSTFAGWSGACTGTGTCSVTMTAAKSVTATFNTTTTFALTVTPAGTGSGTVSSSPSGILCPSTCSANFASGAQVTLTETSNSGSTFAGWSGACSGTGSCVVTMSAVESVTATFNTSGFALTVTEAGSGGGSVTSSPAGISCPSACTANFNSGTQVTLTAAHDSSSTFAGWSGAGCSGTGSCVVTMNAAQAVTATFNITNPTLTVVLGGSGTGSVTFTSSSTFTCSNTTGVVTGTCSANFPNGTVVNMSEAPGTGSTFAGWSGGGCSGTGVTCNVSLTANTTVTATFNKPTFAVTVSASGAGSGTVTSSPGGITCPSTCTANFTSGTSITLTPVAAAGSTFGGWTDATCVDSGTGACTFAVNAAVTVQPVFNKAVYALTVSLAGTGAGSVTSNPTGINCGSGCSASFTSGTVVTLTAAPVTGSVFAGWSGACSGTGSCVITMNAAESVTATFNLPPPSFPLTVTIAQPSSSGAGGTGTVTSSPAGIDCPDACSASYVSGTVVTLRATPGSGSAFAGWSGAGCSGTGTCVVTMNAAESVVATFNTSTFTFGVGPGFSTSVNTTPGGNIVVGFTLSSTTPETVGLGCTSSAPQYLTCQITPTEVSLTGNGPSQVAIVLTSYCQGSTPGLPEGPTPGMPGGVVGVMLLGMTLCGAAWCYRGRRRVALSFAILLFAVVGGSACGNLPKGTAGATPPGLYTLSITATVAGQAPQLIQLQVNVQ